MGLIVNAKGTVVTIVSIVTLIKSAMKIIVGKEMIAVIGNGQCIKKNYANQ
jgi:hypothetical protein